MTAQSLRALSEEVLLPLLEFDHLQALLACRVGRSGLASDQIQHDCGLSFGRPSLDIPIGEGGGWDMVGLLGESLMPLGPTR